MVTSCGHKMESTTVQPTNFVSRSSRTNFNFVTELSIRNVSLFNSKNTKRMSDFSRDFVKYVNRMDSLAALKYVASDICAFSGSTIALFCGNSGSFFSLRESIAHSNDSHVPSEYKTMVFSFGIEIRFSIGFDSCN